MRAYFVAAVCSAIIAALTLASPASAKTVKECQKEWRAHKAANQKAGITEKAYVEKCRGEATSAKSKTEAKSKEKKSKQKAAKEKAAPEKKTAATGGKTVKACEAEWRANKAANQKAGITEKAYVEKCRAGQSAATPKAMPAAPAPAKEKASAPMAPKKIAAPASGKPNGPNQYAAELQAKAHCPRDTVVWANLDSKIYHFAGCADYGHTKIGTYMCEKDAMGQGTRAAKNEKHP
jgi:hypothetical protein